MIDGIPNLRGLNTTEWWIVKEALISGKFNQLKGSGFAEYYEFTIELPSGDQYTIGEFSETVNSCQKLKLKERVTK